MILDLDVGNTRVKWRLLGSDGCSRQEGAATFDEFVRAPGALVAGVPQRVRVSSVRGTDADTSLQASVESAWGGRVEFARASSIAGGVSNGYREPGRLGVDRWLGMLAAYAEFRGAVLVLDFGSAATADLLSADGTHRGGFIAPGLSLMKGSLLSGTESVRFDDHGEVSALHPGRDTAAAVSAGVHLAAVGFAHMAWNCAQSLGGCIGAVLTGGDAPSVLPFLQFEVAYRPTLVLDGLAIAIP